jgi:hydroxymethylpyrimidine/phosphomethylpyrimidine kinase
VASEAERRAAARELARVASAALIKGGHGDEVTTPRGEREEAAAKARDVVVDLLFDGERHHRFEWPRIHTRSTHGTGCTLSAAIAANLGRGLPLEQAIAEAGHYLNAALRTAYPLGHGHGPVNHGCRFLRPPEE